MHRVQMWYLVHSADAWFSRRTSSLDTSVCAAPDLQQTGSDRCVDHVGTGILVQSLFYCCITMAIWLAVLAWQICGANGCSAWGEIMMGCWGRNHSLSETVIISATVPAQNWTDEKLLKPIRPQGLFATLNTTILSHMLTCRGLRGGWDRMMLELLPWCGVRFPVKRGFYSTRVRRYVRCVLIKTPGVLYEW